MKSILKYIGKKDIKLEDYNINKYKRYCEPFAGSFNCGFELADSNYNGELICNDLDYNVYNFWKVIEENPELLYYECKKLESELYKVSKEERIKVIENKYINSDKIVKAATEYMYRRVKIINSDRGSIRLSDMLLYDMVLTSEVIKDKHIKIKNLDYKEIFKEHDKTDTFMLIDPPYDVKNVNHYYRYGANKDFHEELANEIMNLKCSWLLTYNDSEHIRSLYSKCNIAEVNRQMANKKYKELYITRRE